ncbi:MAG: transcriptional repressor [Deltaproteobacteria bacterium]|nr:transcriptional repressor [Deltaproteobacteria bacterium]
MPGSPKWRHTFQGHVSRWTIPREIILDFLSRTPKHLSAKEIYSSLYKTHPGIGLTTVYRTLDLLARMGLVTKLILGDGQNRYEFKSSDKEEHHHHLLCTNCGKIIDYSEFLNEELELVRKTEQKLEKKYNFKIQDHNIEFLGLCEKCSANSERELK